MILSSWFGAKYLYVNILSFNLLIIPFLKIFFIFHIKIHPCVSFCFLLIVSALYLVQDQTNYFIQLIC